jgi:antitoxin (DNA-binding transcriptional repressor) of toxin-antitoxin stability system
MEVDVQALHDELSCCLAEVHNGRTVTITDRGRVVARIVPAGQPSELERLGAEDRASAAARPKRAAPTPVPASGTVSDLVAEQRR